MEEHLSAIKEWFLRSERKIHNLNSELLRAQGAEDEHKKQARRFESQCAAGEQREYELSQRLKELRSNDERKSEQIENLKEKLSASNKQVRGLSEKLSQNVEKQNSEKAEWRKFFQSCQSQKQQDQRRIQCLEQDLRNKQTELDHSVTSANKLKEDMLFRERRLKESIVSLEAQKKALFERIAIQAETLQSLKSEKHCVEEQLSNVKQVNQDLEKKIRGLTSDYQKVTSTYILEKSNLETYIEQLKSGIEEARQQAEEKFQSETRKTEEQFQAEVETFVQRVNEKKLSIEEFKRNERELRKSIDDLRAKNHSLHFELNQLRQKVSVGNTEDGKDWRSRPKVPLHVSRKINPPIKLKETKEDKPPQVLKVRQLKT